MEHEGAETDDLSLSFCDKVWLSQVPLTKESVLEYFALSPFYDRSSNNESVRGAPQVEASLRSLTGLEFGVHACKPPQWFAIGKYQRSSPKDRVLLCLYYVLNGVVYKAPDVQEVVSAKLAQSALHIQRALAALDRSGSLSLSSTIEGEEEAANGYLPVVGTHVAQLAGEDRVIASAAVLDRHCAGVYDESRARQEIHRQRFADSTLLQFFTAMHHELSNEKEEL